MYKNGLGTAIKRNQSKCIKSRWEDISLKEKTKCCILGVRLNAFGNTTPVLDNKMYSFIAITPKSTLTWSGSTC